MTKTIYKTAAMQTAAESGNPAAFAEAALAYCQPFATREGARENALRITTHQIQVELLASFTSNDAGGDGWRNVRGNSSVTQRARTMSWSTQSLTLSAEDVLAAADKVRHQDDGVTRYAENEFSVIFGGIESARFQIEDISGLEKIDGGELASWMMSIGK